MTILEQSETGIMKLRKNNGDFPDYPFWLKCWLQKRINHWNTTSKFITCIFLCLFLLLISGCNSAKQRDVNEKANEIYQSLFIPADSVLLDKIENDHLLAYAHGCSGTVLEIAYGSNRPLIEIIEEYHQALLMAGWELHLDYRPNRTDDTAVYQMGSRTKLRILSAPVNISLPTPVPGEQAFVTIYSIMLTYTEPSNADCIG